MDVSTRIQELTEFIEAEGISLSYSVEDVIRLEDSGYVVDFESGAILDADSITIELTPGGEALALIWELLDKEPQR